MRVFGQAQVKLVLLYKVADFQYVELCYLSNKQKASSIGLFVKFDFLTD